MPKERRQGMLDAIRRALRRAALSAGDVYVGVHKDDAERLPQNDEEETLNNAQIAAIHEFGLGVPERSFLRSTIRAEQQRYKTLFAAEMRRELKRKHADPKRPLHVVGNVAASDVQQTIARGVQPGLSEATLEKRRERGFSGTKPLIETGQLKSSITYSVGKPDDEEKEA